MAQLTDREVEVLTHLAQGEKAREIAERLDITVRTVAAHIKSTCDKLGASNGANAVAIALTRDLI